MKAPVFAAIAASLVLSSGVLAAQGPQLVRSLSGPSGKTVGPDFVLDEIRNRFVYPQDRALTVYFEWDAPPGDHTMTATWIRPDGRVATISPDVKMQSVSRQLKAYWVFPLTPDVSSGAWTVSVRIDGQPAGSHVFEIVGVEVPERFTLDRVSKLYGPAIVRVSRLDATGQRLGTATGAVIANGLIVTAFQAIDGASRLEIEFAGGRRDQSTSIGAFSRLNDWATIKADTASIAPIPRGDAGTIPIGSRLAAFDIDTGTTVVVPVDVGAVAGPSGYAARIRFGPSLSPAAVGGPLIDEQGTVVGIVGGTMTPGLGMTQRLYSDGSGSLRLSSSGASATIISSLPPALPMAVVELAELAANGTLTPMLKPMPELIDGGITSRLLSDGMMAAVPEREFSTRNDTTISIYTRWVKRTKLSKGEITVRIYDPSNRLQTASPPKKMSLSDAGERHVLSFNSKGLPTGFYRVDVCWDNVPVWRNYLQIVD